MADKNHSEKTTNRPVHTARYGVINAAVWRNTVDSGNNSRPMYNVTVSRSYRDGDTWKDSTSFGYEDLLLVSKAVNDCHSFIHEQLGRDNHEQRDNRSDK